NPRAVRAAVAPSRGSFDPLLLEGHTMSETAHSNSTPLSSFELERQAAIERNLFIQGCVRAAVKWLRMRVLRSARFARRAAAGRQRRSAIRQLRRLDDRTLKDMGIHRGEIEFGVRNGGPPRAGRHPRPDRRANPPARARAASSQATA